MAKDFNVQTAFQKLIEDVQKPSGERIMVTLDDQRIDDLFQNQYNGEIDYIHDGSDVYYIVYVSEFNKFIDYIESLGLDSNDIKTHANFQENVTGGGEAYLPAMNVPAKKQNPFKEDKYSGYTQDKKFRPGHTPDKGGFQYKDLWNVNETNNELESIKNRVIAWSKTLPKGTFDSWGDFEDNVRQSTTKSQIRDAMIDANDSKDLNVTDKFDELGLGYDESEKSTDPLMKKSTTNSEELARLQGLLQRANDEKSYSVMSAYEYHIRMLRILVAIEKKYNTTLPLFAMSDSVNGYLRKNFPGFTGKFGPYNQKWNLVATHIEKSLQDQNLEEEACWSGYQQIGMKDKDGKQVPNCVPVNENIERDQKVKIVKGTYAGNTAIVHDFDSDKDTASGDDWVDVLVGDKKEKKTVKASELKAINENYSRFRNETKTRSGSEQYHQAVKQVKKKVQEISKLHTYLERMQQELSETKEGLKKKKYTQMAIDKIKAEVKELNKKIRKLK